MTEKARWFPEQPPMLDGEDAGIYTDRITGASGQDAYPYDHRRYRECSMGYHETCSQRDVQGLPAPPEDGCQCPCHTALGAAELRLQILEEAFVAAYACASGHREGDRAAGIVQAIAGDVTPIIERRPQLAEWYLSKLKGGTDA